MTAEAIHVIALSPLARAAAATACQPLLRLPRDRQVTEKSRESVLRAVVPLLTVDECADILTSPFDSVIRCQSSLYLPLLRKPEYHVSENNRTMSLEVPYLASCTPDFRAMTRRHLASLAPDHPLLAKPAAPAPIALSDADAASLAPADSKPDKPAADKPKRATKARKEKKSAPAEAVQA
jgi:hypothetical protein